MGRGPELGGNEVVSAEVCVCVCVCPLDQRLAFILSTRKVLQLTGNFCARLGKKFAWSGRASVGQAGGRSSCFINQRPAGQHCCKCTRAVHAHDSANCSRAQLVQYSRPPLAKFNFDRPAPCGAVSRRANSIVFGPESRPSRALVSATRSTTETSQPNELTTGRSRGQQ